MARSLSDHALVKKRSQRLIESLHSVYILPGLHHRIDLMNLVFTDQIPNGGIGDQNLHSQCAATAVGFGKQGLAEDAFESERELGPNLRLLH